MPDLIILRLHPVNPTDGNSFTSYLTGLEIGFDLRLMPSVSDVRSIPTEGTNLVIVADVNGVLHFRIFDAAGEVVVDTDEKSLTTQAGPITDLKRQLESLWPPNEITNTEKYQVIAAVISIVGRTLEITISDRQFADPSVKENVIGTAKYDPDLTKTTIVQHFSGPFRSVPMPAATAVVEIKLPASPYPEYPENNLPNDLVLTITRSGKKIVDHSINYNVDVLRGVPLPETALLVYAKLTPIALYLPLPDPHLGLDPNLAYLDLPPDGTPPNFDDLKKAVQKVLAKDPGGSPDITAITPDQCRHIAYEIVWNRTIDPLPVPPGGLTIDELYDSSAGKDKDNERRQFEADLTTYYTIHNTRADTLAKFVYSMSAAFACNKKSQDVDHVGFRFPILPGLSVTSEKVAEATVVISQ